MGTLGVAVGVLGAAWALHAHDGTAAHLATGH